MNTYLVWVRINQYQTVNIRINADYDYQAKQIAEGTYGAGSVLNYTLVNE